MKFIKTFIVIFLFFSNNLLAQGKIISGTPSCFQLISGTVKNKLTNSLIEDATVELYTLNSLLQTIQTDNKGNFKFKVACDAPYQLVSFKGVLPKTKENFVTTDAGNIRVQFILLIEDTDKCTITVEGIVKNDENEFLNESVIILYDKDKEINRAIVKKDGTYQFVLECNKPYKIIAQSVNHIEAGFVLNSGTQNNMNVEKNITLEKLACIKNLYGSVKDIKTNSIIVGASVNLLLDGSSIKSTETDNEGKFHFKVKCSPNYSVSVAKTDYQKSNFRVTEIKYGQEDYFLNTQINPIAKENVVEEIAEIKEETNDNVVNSIIENEPIAEDKPFLKLLEVGEIEFDLNESKITRTIAIELDKIVVIMMSNPAINILLNSHTDSRGPDVYNINLTEARAQSMVNYIISNGIDSNRVKGRGYGETSLTNDCTNGKRCSEAEHQKNRRNEFIISYE